MSRARGSVINSRGSLLKQHCKSVLSILLQSVPAQSGVTREPLTGESIEEIPLGVSQRNQIGGGIS